MHGGPGRGHNSFGGRGPLGGGRGGGGGGGGFHDGFPRGGGGGFDGEFEFEGGGPGFSGRGGPGFMHGGRGGGGGGGNGFMGDMHMDGQFDVGMDPREQMHLGRVMGAGGPGGAGGGPPGDRRHMAMGVGMGPMPGHGGLPMDIGLDNDMMGPGEFMSHGPPPPFRGGPGGAGPVPPFMGPPPFGFPGMPGPPGMQRGGMPPPPLPPPHAHRNQHGGRNLPQPPPAPGTLGGGPGGMKGQANDYSQNYVDTGLRPQNYLRDTELSVRYDEYPKLQELIQRKNQLTRELATPPLFLKADLKTLKLSPDTFGTKFDVILVDPPWEEYVRRAPGMVADPEVWGWQEIMALEIEAVADTPCVLYLWCGSEEGLDAGRHCLKKWGFRRSEDICWVKTNKDPSRKYLSAINQPASSMLVHTKEHCLMGIKGNVRRAQDGHIIHANCDTDVIVSEEPELGSCEKPEEMYQVIEHFSLGRRRLELFGEDHNIRPGWVTVGKRLTHSNFDAPSYAANFRNPNGSIWIGNPYGNRIPLGAPVLLPVVDEIDDLRPRSPLNERGGRGGRD